MWHDDEGDDPIAGPVPDPSARHWRHPSELAAENAKAAAARHGGMDRRATVGGSTSTLWPISVVGGCIAIAAFGILGLYASGSSSDSELLAGGTNGLETAPTGSATTTTVQAARTGSALNLGPYRSGVAGGSDLAESPDATVSTSTSAAPSEASPTGVDPATDAGTVGTEPRTVITSPVGPAVYARVNPYSDPLASLVATGEHWITSASALAGHHRVQVRVGNTWLAATVIGSDILTDVALLVPDDPGAGVAIPHIALTTDPVIPGTEIFVGYCRSESVAAEPDRLLSTPNCSLAPLPDGEAATAQDSAPDVAVGFPAIPGDGGLWGQTESQRSGRQGRSGSSEVEDRAGTVYSIDQAMRTLANRWIYQPIRTEVPQRDGMAGGPLRDIYGRIVGLVVGSDLPSVSALPIDRAMAVVDSLIASGVGNPAWIGVHGEPSPAGIEVRRVDDDGPAADLVQAGDVIVAADGMTLVESDHLEHLVRQAGPGALIDLTITRHSETLSVPIRIASR